MRPMFAVVLLAAACATSVETTPAQRVAGCWIDRASEGAATTMRWFTDAQRAGAMRGVKTAYGAAGATTNEEYVLNERGGSWAMCRLEAQGERCWQVAQGESGSLEGGRAFVDALGDRLRISIVDMGGTERVIFHGRRDGCD